MRDEKAKRENKDGGLLVYGSCSWAEEGLEPSHSDEAEPKETTSPSFLDDDGEEKDEGKDHQ